MLSTVSFLTRPARSVVVGGLSERIALSTTKRLPEPLRRRFRSFYAFLMSTGRRQIPQSHVTVYASSDYLASAEWESCSSLIKDQLVPVTLDELRTRYQSQSFSYSLVATCLNEEKDIVEWLDAIATQSFPPAEIVLCDGGSKDRTVQLARAWQAQRDSHINIIESRGLNIAAGRNRAIRAASHDMVLLSDVGAPPEREWAEKLLLPFCDDDTLTGVFGFYRVAWRPGGFRSAVLDLIVPKLKDIDPATFLPSARSFALRRRAWREAGGYPEYLTLAGEDTLFDYYLKSRFSRFGFVPEAKANWVPPRGLFRLIASYAAGDAEAQKLFWPHYVWLAISMSTIAIETTAVAALVALTFLTQWLLFPLLLLVFIPTVVFRLREIVHRFSPGFTSTSLRARLTRVFSILFVAAAQTTGFLRGLRRRRAVEDRRLRETRGDVVVLADSLPFEEGSAKEVDDTVDEHLRGGRDVTLVLFHREALSAKRIFDHPHYRELLKDDFSSIVGAPESASRESLIVDLTRAETPVHQVLKQKKGGKFMPIQPAKPRKAAVR